MKTYTLICPLTVSFRNWLYRNIGSIDEKWCLTMDNRLTFKDDADATYFELTYPDMVNGNAIHWDAGKAKDTKC